MQAKYSQEDINRLFKSGPSILERAAHVAAAANKKRIRTKLMAEADDLIHATKPNDSPENHIDNTEVDVYQPSDTSDIISDAYEEAKELMDKLWTPCEEISEILKTASPEALENLNDHLGDMLTETDPEYLQDQDETQLQVMKAILYKFV